MGIKGAGITSSDDVSLQKGVLEQLNVPMRYYII